ncbi:MAG: ParB/RepB/Spo0J family partition protein [Ilumatobacteraceae bacterium]
MNTNSIEEVAISELNIHPNNPRQGDIGVLVQSIETNGWYGTIVAQRSTKQVLAGNHRLMAAQIAGIETVPVYWVDVDDATATRILLADNRTSDLAIYDDSSLAELLSGLAETEVGVAGTGYDDSDLEALLFELGKDKSYGTLINDNDTVSERAETVEAAGIRSIIIPFALEDYNRVVARMAELRNVHNVDSNADLILALIEE